MQGAIYKREIVGELKRVESHLIESYEKKS